MMGYYVLSLSAELFPGETKEFFVEPTSGFRAERLVVAEVPRTRSQVVLAHVFNFLPAVLENLFALFSGYACPGWKLPPYFPMEILVHVYDQLRVGSYEQFTSGNKIPAQIFGEAAFAPNCHFDTCKIGQRLTLTVRSNAKHPFTFRAGFIGECL